MKIEFFDREMVVHLRVPSAAEAAEILVFNAEEPPDGYKWMAGRVMRRGKSGQNVNLELLFLHCDRRVDPLSWSEAIAIFEKGITLDPVPAPL